MLKKIKKNVAASWCCEASTVIDIQNLLKKAEQTKKASNKTK